MARSRFLTLAICTLAVSAAGPAAWPRQVETPMAPEPDGAAPSIAELIAVARERSPELAAARARERAAAARVAPAGTLPDPMVEASLLNLAEPALSLGRDPDSMLELGLRQELPYPGKRGAARAAAAAEAAIAAAEVAVLEREIVLRVRREMAELYALDTERRALEEAHELLDLLAATASARYGAGQGEQEAVIKAQLEISLHGQRMEDVEQRRRSALARLNRVLDRPGSAYLPAVTALPVPQPPPAPWEELAAAGAPQVAVANARSAAAERGVEVARLGLKPDFSAGAGYAWREEIEAMVRLSFGVRLPVWRKSKQKPLVAGAEEELAAARLDVAAAQAEARAEAARIAADWGRATVQERRYREAILPQTSAALDAARTSYMNGRGDFSTVVEDFEMWLHARIDLARTQAERFVAWSELAALIAAEPVGDSP